MTTWEEIRDEVAGMLADGKPLEDVIGNLEKRKNEMAKANLIEAIEEMKKPKLMTNEEWRKTCSAEEFAEWIAKEKCDGCEDGFYDEEYAVCRYCMDNKKGKVLNWLRTMHK